MSDTTAENASESPPGSEGTSEEKSGGRAGKVAGKEFGGLSPREAALRSQARQAAKRRAQHDAPPRTPQASDVAIEDALRTKAEAGDVAAARALIEWRRSRPQGEEHGDRWLELLTPEQRSTVGVWLMQAKERLKGEATR